MDGGVISRRNLLKGVAASVSLAVLIPVPSVLVQDISSLPAGWKYVVEKFDYDRTLGVAVVSENGDVGHAYRLPDFVENRRAKEQLDAAMVGLRRWVIEKGAPQLAGLAV